MTFLRIVIPLHHYCLSMISAQTLSRLSRGIMLYLVATFTASAGRLESSACRVAMVE